MTTRRLTIGLCLFLCACSGNSPKAKSTPQSDECRSAAKLLTKAEAQSDDGYLGRALREIKAADKACSTEASRRALAAIRKDLWIDKPTIDAIQKHRRAVTAEDKNKARNYYRAGAVLSANKRYAFALKRLDQAYRLWPHPLTIVQMGQVHKAAGRMVEYRKANARALAVAEATRRTKATLLLRGGHSSAVTAVAFHPKRNRLASAGYDNTVKLWDLTTSGTGRVRTLTGHNNLVYSVAFSPDGAQLASASYDKTVKLWDAATGRLVRTLTGHTRAVMSVAFSPDGAQLASASYDKTVKLWDAATGSLLASLVPLSTGRWLVTSADHRVDGPLGTTALSRSSTGASAMCSSLVLSAGSANTPPACFATSSNTRARTNARRSPLRASTTAVKCVDLKTSHSFASHHFSHHLDETPGTPW